MATKKPATTTSGFTKKRNLTLPVLKQVDEKPFNVKITSAMVQSKAIQQQEGKQKMDPATICQVVNLDSGEEQTLICNSVLASTLNEHYPDNSYVGLCFEVIRHAKPVDAEGKPTKRYHTYSIAELEAPAE